MPRFAIESTDDPHIDAYRDLKDARRILRTGLFVAEGAKLVEQLLVSRYPVESLLISDRYEARLSPRVDPRTPVYVAEHALLERIVGFRFHRGVLACGRRLPLPSVTDLAPEGVDPLTLVICPDLQDPTNLGLLIRLCLAFGVDAFVTGPQGPDFFSRRVLRTSMGAVLAQPATRSSDLQRDLQWLRSRRGVRLLATVLDAGAEPLARTPRSERFALLLGSESTGLTPDWVDLCDRRITIPMRPGCDSLNVSVACGIFLHHLSPGPDH